MNPWWSFGSVVRRNVAQRCRIHRQGTESEPWGMSPIILVYYLKEYCCTNIGPSAFSTYIRVYSESSTPATQNCVRRGEHALPVVHRSIVKCLAPRLAQYFRVKMLFVVCFIKSSSHPLDSIVQLRGLRVTCVPHPMPRIVPQAQLTSRRATTLLFRDNLPSNLRSSTWYSKVPSR